MGRANLPDGVGEGKSNRIRIHAQAGEALPLVPPDAQLLGQVVTELSAVKGFIGNTRTIAVFRRGR